MMMMGGGGMGGGGGFPLSPTSPTSHHQHHQHHQAMGGFTPDLNAAWRQFKATPGLGAEAGARVHAAKSALASAKATLAGLAREVNEKKGRVDAGLVKLGEVKARSNARSGGDNGGGATAPNPPEVHHMEGEGGHAAAATKPHAPATSKPAAPPKLPPRLTGRVPMMPTTTMPTTIPMALVVVLALVGVALPPPPPWWRRSFPWQRR